jgi:hypothetical protein
MAERDREQKRDRHGFRGTPPPASFSLADLPDDALLTEYEVAAVGRWSTNTLAAWRRQPGHPLEWELLAGKYVRCRAGNLKRYMAGDSRKKPKPPAPPKHPDTKQLELTNKAAPVATAKRRAQRTLPAPLPINN